MKIICAGLPKTGTKSLAEALRILGYNVHDIEEHRTYFLDEYIKGLEGQQIDLRVMYERVDVVIDVPSVCLWKEMINSFPDAKVVLMVRDSAEMWCESYYKTCNALKSVKSSVSTKLGHACTPTGRKFKKLSLLMHNTLLRNLICDWDANIAKQLYNEHNARVKAAVPRDQLLVYNVKQGWKPLCDFLGVDVPDIAFPRLNVDSQGIPDIINKSSVKKRMDRELFSMLAIVAVVVAVIVYVLL